MVDIQATVNALRLEDLEVTGNLKRITEFVKGLDDAISAMQELQKYRHVGTLEECMDAMFLSELLKISKYALGREKHVKPT